jgi:tetratricopeptide (TPR) repeat protein
MQRKIKKFKKWLRTLPRRTKVLAGVGALGVIFVIVIIVALIKINTQPPVSINDDLNAKQAAEQAAKMQQLKREGAVRDSAEQALEQGDTAKANSLYTEAINAEDDAPKKVQLAIDQSGVLYAANKFDDAINVAKSAEDYSTDKYLIANWLSKLYEDQKQYELAAQYYKLAGKWASSPTNKSHLKQEYYDAQAKRVLVLAGKS